MHQPRLELQLLKVGSCMHLECLAMQGGALRPIVFPALSGLMIHPSVGPILFDTGYSEHFRSATQPFPERLYRWTTPMRLPSNQTLQRQLARFGVGLEDVALCVVSHFHGDHVAGLRDLPNAKILAMQSGYENLKQRGRWRALMSGNLPALLPADLSSRLQFAESTPAVMLPSPWGELGHGFDLLGDQSILGIPLPGHAPGQLGLLIRDAVDRQVLLAADASWSMRAVAALKMPSLLARPVIHNWQVYRSTLGVLHRASVAHPDISILPSHCNVSLAGYQPSWAEQ
jgi:glyoxylase-like metal-dependent hydrolase (beta-lactamase superfamily II)